MINRVLQIATQGQGLYEITDEVQGVLSQFEGSEALCVIFVQHTSASLIIQENADPSARRDLEKWLRRLVPERDPLYTHTHEGPDDMPAHIKAALTATSLTIPVIGGVLALGTWQGIYLWEHRSSFQRRRVMVSILGSV